MRLEFWRERFQSLAERPALVGREEALSYQALLQKMDDWGEELERLQVPQHSVVGLRGDFTPDGIGILLALAERECTVALLPNQPGEDPASISGVSTEIVVADGVKINRVEPSEIHPLIQELWAENRPGLIQFSSGSTGRMKAILHDFGAILKKFEVPRPGKRMLGFLLFDHIGGINTCFHLLSSGGCLVTIADRKPETVCRAIAEHRVEILPTTPTFLNLLLLSGAAEKFDLSSLNLITYGTEPMPESLLTRVHAAFPGIKLQQTYGLSEVGILRSKSESDNSLWVKLGGEGFATRVRDGLLEIKSQSAMRGYLNAPSPFTEDGWFMTGDAVEVRGEYFRILGRKSDLINVGGEKVYPSEVENTIRNLDGILNVAVHGERNAITGQMVVATVCTDSEEAPGEIRARVQSFCRNYLPRFKVPQKVIVTRSPLHGERFKTLRARPA